jgi:hypothetical protein
MPDQQHPNEASRKSKAEGERWVPEDEHGERDWSGEQRTDEQGAGTTNRPLDQEIENQKPRPARGTSEPGPPAGSGDDETDERRSER